MLIVFTQLTRHSWELSPTEDQITVNSAAPTLVDWISSSQMSVVFQLWKDESPVRINVKTHYTFPLSGVSLWVYQTFGARKE